MPSPVPPYLRVVEVSRREGIEDGALLFERNPDSGVGDDEMDGVRLGVTGFQFHLRSDFAFVDELDGITNQVEDDLTQPHGISANGFRNVGSDMAKEFEALFIGAMGKSFEGGFLAVPQIEIAGFRFDFAGLHSGQVENIVADGEQRVGGELNGLQIIAMVSRGDKRKDKEERADIRFEDEFQNEKSFASIATPPRSISVIGGKPRACQVDLIHVKSIS